MAIRQIIHDNLDNIQQLQNAESQKFIAPALGYNIGNKTTWYGKACK